MPKVMNCENCGDIEMAWIDGYAVGDRLLEGVTFEIRIVKGKVQATTALGCKSYMASLNEKKWLREVARAADGYDNLECPTCHGEVFVGPAQKPVVLTMTGEDFMRDFITLPDESKANAGTLDEVYELAYLLRRYEGITLGELAQYGDKLTMIEALREHHRRHNKDKIQ